MKNAVLLSIHAPWIEKIMSGEKTYEVRKRAPIIRQPFKVYLYCTKKEPTLTHNGEIMNGKICGEFTCTRIIEMHPPWFNKNQGTCLSGIELAAYAGGEPLFYMEVSKPKYYDKPFSLADFKLKSPPMSWHYCEQL